MEHFAAPSEKPLMGRKAGTYFTEFHGNTVFQLWRICQILSAFTITEQ